MSLTDRSVVESLAKPALVAAVGLAVVQFLLALPGSFSGGLVGFVRFGLSQVVGVLGDAAVFAAILALIVLGTGAEVVKWGAIGLYVVAFVQELLFAALYFRLGFGILVDPLYPVAFFLAIVVALRTYRGESVLPGVDLTVDTDRFTFTRGGPAPESLAEGGQPKPR